MSDMNETNNLIANAFSGFNSETILSPVEASIETFNSQVVPKEKVECLDNLTRVEKITEWIKYIEEGMVYSGYDIHNLEKLEKDIDINYMLRSLLNPRQSKKFIERERVMIQQKNGKSSERIKYSFNTEKYFEIKKYVAKHAPQKFLPLKPYLDEIEYSLMEFYVPSLNNARELNDSRIIYNYKIAYAEPLTNIIGHRPHSFSMLFNGIQSIKEKDYFDTVDNVIERIWKKAIDKYVRLQRINKGKFNMNKMGYTALNIIKRYDDAEEMMNKAITNYNKYAGEKINFHTTK